METVDLIRFIRIGHTIRRELAAERQAKRRAAVLKQVMRVYAFLIGLFGTLVIIQGH